jgi:hypothetical protein
MKLKDKLIKKLKSPGYENHRFTFTRRELIRMGLIAAGGYVMPLPRMQLAQALAGTTPTLPFLVFDLAGGAAMPGNFLVGGKGGPEDLVENYRLHGWNPRASNSLDKTFGLPMSRERSKMLEGLRQTLPKSITDSPTQQLLKMASFAHFSLDDTGGNRSSAITMVAKSGLTGQYVKAGLGMSSSSSGGNSDVYLRDPKFRPRAVASSQDVMGLTLFDDDYTQLDASTRKAIFNNLKTAAGNNSTLRDAYESIENLGIAVPAMDVTKRSDIATLYRLNQGGSDLEASIVYNVLNGYTGPGVITIGDCDYHNNTGTKGDATDLAIGQSIGRAVAAAQLLNKPLLIQIITDGGIYSPRSDNYERVWVGDANQHSLSVLAYFDPNKAVRMRQLQVGNYTDSGQVESTTFIGSGPEKMALGVLLNYLYLTGNMDRFEAASGTRLAPDEMDKLLVFG